MFNTIFEHKCAVCGKRENKSLYFHNMTYRQEYYAPKQVETTRYFNYYWSKVGKKEIYSKT